jgi:outer membrane lipoprotein-sorting protein
MKVGLACTIAITVGLSACLLRAGLSTTEPALWNELTQLDEKVSKIDSVTADFEQRKYTPMLKKPLVSSGTIVAEGSTALWKTGKPSPTCMLVSPKEIRIYYPAQALVEIYPVQGQLGALAASPLPRLEVLKQFFRFERDSAASLDATKTDADYLAVKLTPIHDDLRQHVKQVRVLLDRKTGAIQLAENIDADGDRTVLVFSNLKMDVRLAADALQLNVPAGTNQTLPLDGMDAADGPR